MAGVGSSGVAVLGLGGCASQNGGAGLGELTRAVPEAFLHGGGKDNGV